MSTLDGLAPELYEVISNHIPPSVTPCTLLSLALADKTRCAIVLPLLWTDLTLKTEQPSIAALKNILEDPSKGASVRSICILTSISKPPPYQITKKKLAKYLAKHPNVELNVLYYLRAGILAQAYPRLKALHIQFNRSWLLAEVEQETRVSDMRYGDYLKGSLWDAIEKAGVGLRSVNLVGLSDWQGKSLGQWLPNSGLFRMKV